MSASPRCRAAASTGTRRRAARSCGSASANGTKHLRKPTGDSVSRHYSEVQPLQCERACVLLDEIAHVEASIAELRADVVGHVHGAVDVEIRVMSLEVLGDAVRNFDAGQL